VALGQKDKTCVQKITAPIEGDVGSANSDRKDQDAGRLAAGAVIPETGGPGTT